MAYRHSEDDAVLALQRDGLEGSGVSRSGAEGERVLGIDPGTRVLGYGVVEGNGRGEPRLVAVGSFRVERAGEGYASLLAIRRCVCALVEWYAPGVVAIEAPFLGKNAQSMLKLGRAQGVAIAALVELGEDVAHGVWRCVEGAGEGHAVEHVPGGGDYGAKGSRFDGCFGRGDVPLP